MIAVADPSRTIAASHAAGLSDRDMREVPFIPEFGQAYAEQTEPLKLNDTGPTPLEGYLNAPGITNYRDKP